MPHDTTPRTESGDEDDGVDRRRVLRGAAAGAAAIVGLPGTAAAEAAGFESPEAMRDAFADHEDLLADLADRGLIEARTADELTLDPLGEDRADGHEVVRRRRTPGGSAVTEVKLVRRTDEGPLTVAVRPGTGDSYAVLGGENEEVVEPLAGCPCVECLGVYCCRGGVNYCEEFCFGCVCHCP